VIFYLGTHEPHWLSRSHVPLFISAVRLRSRCKETLPKARVPWALDSGGFSVIKGPEGYPQSAEEYACEVRRWRDGIGNLDFAAIQDWMCEPVKLDRTGFTVEEHQKRTVQSWLDLRRIAPDLPWLPVLQGFTRDEYLRCARMYRDAGTDLSGRWVGIGSVCRREETAEAEEIIRELAGMGLYLHGFGFKTAGVERSKKALFSADSLAWSFAARRRSNAARKERARLTRQPSLFDAEDDGPVAVALKKCKSPQNSPRFALAWLSDVEVRAGMKEEAGMLHPCPFCGSNEVHPPISSELDYSCVECGESWGDIREPSLR
jgi:hypothetical protein